MPPFDQEIKSSKFTSEQQKAMLNIIFTGNWLLHLHAGYLKSFDLSPQQYNILRILRGQAAPMTMNQIKCRMLDKTPNMTRLADKLMKKELLDRIRCNKDRRVVFLEINNSGLELLDKIDIQWSNQYRPEFKLSDEEAFIVNQLLDKMRS